MARPKVNLELTVTGFYKLSQYLEDHEKEIADKDSDLAKLRELYVVVFDDNPEE